MESKIETLYKKYLETPVISKDSREKLKGGIYFSLKGEKFDGNEFAKDAINNGASIAVIDNEKYALNEKYFLVNDCLKALQDLARMHRSKLSIPFIGITGSNGKTTTKELISSVLLKKYKTHFTQGNYNNHIGVPLTILQINNSHEMAVIEMGANHKKEIEFLCTISDPDYGLITNIGKAHLEGFGGVEGIKIGKSELYKHIQAKDGWIFRNGDDPVLKELSEKNKCIDYGTNENFFCSASLINSQPIIEGIWTCKDKNGSFKSKLYGDYNFYNILAAVAIGRYFNVDSNLIDEAIGGYESDMNRSQKIKKEDHIIYLDAYNANPSSMEAAIRNFSKDNASKKMIFLGDMFELGEDSQIEHQKILDLSLELGFDKIILAGLNFLNTDSKNDSVIQFKTTAEVKEWYKKEDKKGCSILIKGSRGMAMEKIIE